MKEFKDPTARATFSIFSSQTLRLEILGQEFAIVKDVPWPSQPQNSRVIHAFTK